MYCLYTVLLKAISSFKQPAKKEKKVRYPATKEMMPVPKSNTIKFTQTSRAD